MENAEPLESTLPPQLAIQIEEVFNNWDNPNSRHRESFEVACQEFQSRAELIANEAAATERLDAKDFAFRINATR